MIANVTFPFRLPYYLGSLDASVLLQHFLPSQLGILRVRGVVQCGIERSPADAQGLADGVSLAPWNYDNLYFPCHNNTFIDKCFVISIILRIFAVCAAIRTNPEHIRNAFTVQI